MSADKVSETPAGEIQSRLAKKGITAHAVLDRLLEVLELRRDADLAKYLSVSKATISTWRSRNKIPYDMILLAYIERKIDIIYCLTGEKLSGTGYLGYHGGQELAAIIGEFTRRYGPSEKWRLEPASRPPSELPRPASRLLPRSEDGDDGAQ